MNENVTRDARSAVVLMAYGSPERLEDVPAYYADIRGGRPIRPELLDDLVDRYRRLGIDEGSPLNAITEQTRAALEDELGGDIPVFTGMKHWTPRIADAAAGAHVVFTAHSLPARILAEGDPYQEQLLETSRLVAERAGLDEDGWSFSFQSESPTGEPWLGPDILDHLADLDQRGIRNVLVCPVGFVADHLEIRWDLDREARDKAGELGLDFARIEMPNADPAIVAALANIVRRALAVPSQA